jgi:hypothetical protein
MGMTMATPFIALGLLSQPELSRQVVRTVEVGKTFQHVGEIEKEFSKQKAGAEGVTKQDVISRNSMLPQGCGSIRARLSFP